MNITHVMIFVLIIVVCLTHNTFNGTSNSNSEQIKINPALYKNFEQFQDPPTNPPVCTPAPDNRPWTASKPVRSITSRYTGISLNVCPTSSATCDIGNINSEYIVLITTPNNDLPEGALTVNSDGSFTTNVQTNANNQTWRLIHITSPSDLQTYLPETQTALTTSSGKYPYYICLKTPTKEHGSSSGTGTDTTVDLENDPNLALQYENGSISVRPLGEYESQKWLIKENPIEQQSIMILNNNQYTRFTPEFIQSNNGGVNNLDNLTTMNQHNVLKSLAEIKTLLSNREDTNGENPLIVGDTPLTVTLKLGAAQSNPENFQNTKENFQSNNMNSLLNNFQASREQSTQQNVPRNNALYECKIPNFEDFVSLNQMASCTGCSNL